MGALGQDFLGVTVSRLPVVVRGGLRFTQIAAGYLATAKKAGKPAVAKKAAPKKKAVAKKAAPAKKAAAKKTVRKVKAAA